MAMASLLKTNWLVHSVWGKLIGVNYEDRLTNLPDEIITQILSFLPTKDAVKTSVLSTKWIHLWKTVTNLHFDDSQFSANGKTKFIDSVERVIKASNLVLHNLKLACTGSYFLNSCIRDAIRRKVGKIEIDYYQVPKLQNPLYSPLRFPYSFYYHRDSDTHTSDFLTDLSLRGLPLDFNADASVRFSTLKFLKLYEVTFSRMWWWWLDEVNFSLPMLEFLTLYNCKWENVKIVNFVAPLLNTYYFSQCLSNSLLDRDCLIKINGSSITKFDYTGYSMKGFELVRLSSVIHATIDLIKIPLRTCTFLRQLSSLKYLTLSTNTIEALAYVEDLQDCLSAFNNMIHLTISMGRLPMRVETFISLLQSLPVESLFFTKGVSHFKDDSVLRQAKISCSLPHLKVVKFEMFNAEKCELRLAKFLFKNANNLEEMTTIAGFDLRYCSNIEIEADKEQVLVSPRGSEDNTISFKTNAEHTKGTQEALIHFVVQFFIGVTSCLVFAYLRFLISQ